MRVCCVMTSEVVCGCFQPQGNESLIAWVRGRHEDCWVAECIAAARARRGQVWPHYDRLWENTSYLKALNDSEAFYKWVRARGSTCPPPVCSPPVCSFSEGSWCPPPDNRGEPQCNRCCHGDRRWSGWMCFSKQGGCGRRCP